MKKYYFLIIVALILGLVLTGCSLLSNVGQVPATEQSGITYLTKGGPETIDLYAGAGQNILVGTVEVSNDTEYLYVTYMVDAPWCLTETHLAVAPVGGNDSPTSEDIPQTKKGNPIPGQFPYQCCYDEDAAQWVFQIKEDGDENAVCDADDSPETCLTAITYTIPLDWVLDTELFIAAHAVVQKTTVITAAPYYASLVIDNSQGPKKNGAPVDVERSVPEQGLVFETGRDPSNFFSLGFGGWIIVEFDCPIQNGEGDDIRIIEDTWGSYPLETAEVYASQDGTIWIDLGEADNTVRHIIDIHTVTAFDLGSLEWAKYIKIVDTSDPSVHKNNADGYDLNAVESLQDCVEIQEETAWADGYRFTPRGNWATYFNYTVEVYSFTNTQSVSDGTVGDLVTTVAEDGDWMVWTFDFPVEQFTGDGNLSVGLIVALDGEGQGPAFQIHNNDGADSSYPWGTWLMSPWGPTIGDGWMGWHSGDTNTPVTSLSWVEAIGQRNTPWEGIVSGDGVMEIRIKKSELGNTFHWAASPTVGSGFWAPAYDDTMQIPTDFSWSTPLVNMGIPNYIAR